MVKIIYDKGGCVGCPTEMGCLGSMCPYCWELIMTCDMCHEEGDKLYRGEDGIDYCEECRDKLFVCITPDNAGDYESRMEE